MSVPRGRLGSYAAWQLRDYLFTTAGAASLLIPFVLGVFPLLLMKIAAAKHGVVGAELQNALNGGFQAFVMILALAGPFFSVAGIVSADRSPGLARFIFSKPVSVPAYYLQAWLVRGVGLLFIALILTQVVNLFAGSVAWFRAIEVIAIAWVMVGGLGLLCSVLVARDIALLMALFLVETIISQIKQNVPGSSWWTKPLLTAMPPFTPLSHVRDALMRGTPLPAGDLWHALLFGAGCLVLALYLVRRMPLVR